MAFCPLCPYQSRGARQRTVLPAGYRVCEACILDTNEKILKPAELAERKEMLGSTEAVLLTQYAEMDGDDRADEIKATVESAPAKWREALAAYYLELVRRRAEKAAHEARRARMADVLAIGEANRKMAEVAAGTPAPATKDPADEDTQRRPTAKTQQSKKGK